jgi:hypothetical protein
MSRVFSSLHQAMVSTHRREEGDMRACTHTPDC